MFELLRPVICDSSRTVAPRRLICKIYRSNAGLAPGFPGFLGPRLSRGPGFLEKGDIMINNFGLSFGFLILFAGGVFGQDITKTFCQDLDKAVIQPMSPTRVDRNESYRDECVFEFLLENTIDTYLTVTKLRTDEASKKEFESDRRLYCFDRGEECAKQRFLGAWDDSFVGRSNTNNLLLLRKGKYIITMFSPKYEVLTLMDERLRDRQLRW